MWVLVVVAVVVAALSGSAVLASRFARERPGRRAEPEPAPQPRPVEVAELAAEAEAVRAAAERAVSAADEARQRAEQVAGLRDQAERRYLDARWEARTAATGESQRLVQRAALDAYRRGELSVAQLNGIWQQTGTGADQPDAPEVRAALREFQQAMAESAEVRQEAHVAEVAAEALVEEVRMAEQDVLVAEQETRPGLDGLLSHHQ
ncbi:hypothetical protein AB0F81_23100 [Actinoplanes sp. NPDC024001]|uniref:hypothetical protein n=1 Tax=Actinoplanes sp. NPDC024001 TaxID=3154598 RepID=UPI0033EF936E